jgi:hypothetical protein
MSGYKIPKSKSSNERRKILRTITSELKKNKTASQISRKLMEKGISYRNTNMLHDIRRKEASFQSKTLEARKKALKWFDNVYEPYRKRKDYSSKSMTKAWERTITQSYETDKQASEGNEIWDLMNEVSPDYIEG